MFALAWISAHAVFEGLEPCSFSMCRRLSEVGGTLRRGSDDAKVEYTA